MKETIKVKLFPIRSKIDWPEAKADLHLADRNSHILRLTTNTKGFEILSQFSKLKSLWCFNVSKKDFDLICECSTLENLYIDTSRTDDITKLNNITNLKILSLESFTNVESLANLSRSLELEGLALINFKRIDSIAHLAGLTNLQQLAVAGGMWARMNISSLKPLESLSNLRYIDLTNLKVKDESLRPLAGLQNLELLEIANFYPMEEFAWLSGNLRDTECSWFEPFVDLRFDCARCGYASRVMLTGKGKTSLCKICDALKLEKHVEQFRKIAMSAVSRV
jgi:Leucine-rich repeat (LRR) protein